MWEWSHTEEAYGYAREQLHAKNKSELLKIVQEWNFHFMDKGSSGFKLKFARTLRGETLADWIWEQASSWEHGRNCSNGGHELYLDPQGYWTVDLRDMPDHWQPSD